MIIQYEQVFEWSDGGPAEPPTPPLQMYLVGIFLSYRLRSTTCSTTLHYMAGNDYRVDKRQVSFVVDSALWVAVKGSAASRGWSVTRLITELLEKEVCRGDAGVGSRDRVGVASSGDSDGAHGGGSGGGHSQSGASGRGVDWDSLLLAGKKSKIYSGVDISILDPIEEIA